MSQASPDAANRPAAVGIGAPPPVAIPKVSRSTQMSSNLFSPVAEECGDHFHRLTCGFVMVAQCALLNYFLVTGLSVTWLWFLAADIALILVSVYCFVNTYLYKRGQYSRFLEAKQPGEIPFAYGLWLFYYISVVTRLIVIYYLLGEAVVGWGNAGSNLLRTTGALGCITSFMLIKSLLLAHPFVLKNHLFVFRLGAETAIDVLDAVDFMDVLLVSGARKVLPSGLTECILTFAATTLLTPACLMSVYSFSRFGYITSVKGRMIRSLHLLFSALLCNFPLFIIRLYIWYALSVTSVSAFVVKNILFVYLNLADLMRQVIPEIASQSSQPPETPAVVYVGTDLSTLEKPPSSLAGSRAGLITSP